MVVKQPPTPNSILKKAEKSSLRIIFSKRGTGEVNIDQFTIV
jgi:hypothetical protein